MLKPNKDRLDYGNLLMPPEGFKLDKAIATSYSLDLDTLISIPVALFFAHSLDIDVKQDIVQVLDSIRRANDAVKVYCQKGQICVPDNQHRLYSFIEPCVVQITPTQRSSFHPKIWVIRYKGGEDEIKYKVIVLSRNLTFDRSMDVAFLLEGDCEKGRPNNFRETKPLVDFVKYLSEQETASWHKSFIQDLGKTKFTLSHNEFESFQFLPTGIPGYKANILFDNRNYDDLLIVSPFLTNGGLKIARSHSGSKPRLISREFELKKVSPDILKGFSSFHLVNDYVNGEEKIDTETEENLSIQYQDIHSKIYSYKYGRDASLLLGSSNCSERAMYNNVEFMICLNGKDSKVGPDVIFSELFNDELNIFQKYDPTNQLSEQEKEILTEEEMLSGLKVELVNSSIEARASKQEDGNYQIEFKYDLTLVHSNNEIEISAELFGSTGQKQILKTGIVNGWNVYNISELDLSSFLIIQIKTKYTSIGFAVKIKISNLPNTRYSKIFRAIISNPQNFLKYIRFLLADNYWEEQLSFSDTDEKGKSKGGTFMSWINYESPIYENMLQAVSREPEKLKEIQNVMETIEKEENETNTIIPEDFRKLWSVFENVNQKENR